MRADTSIQVDNVLNKLSKVKTYGEGWSALCPAHEDSNPSLNVGQGQGGRVLLTCHRGCQFDDIVKALDMTIGEMMPEVAPTGKLELTATYPYHDESGTLLYEIQRFVDEANVKTFRQRSPLPDGKWKPSTQGVRKVLYHLPEVLAAVASGKTVWIAEGEKDVDALREAGFVATTNSGGAGRWDESYSKVLAGNKVIVCADKDEVGKLHAAQIAAELRALGSTVVTLVAPGNFKDVAQMLGASRHVEEMVEFDTRPIWNFKLYMDKLEELAKDKSPAEKKLEAALRLAEGMTVESIYIPVVESWGDFLESTISEQVYVIPEILARQERVIVVAPEGVGKSMLARQIALSTAVGIHPFGKYRMPPIRTLYVDLENPDHIIHKNSQNMLAAVKKSRPADYHLLMENAYIARLPSGLDLLKPNDKAILEALVEKVKPDLMLIGPLYKAYLDPGGLTAEAVAGQVARYLDYLRETYDCALWLEHHAPLGSGGSRDLRPFGSSVWSRWSEFGLTLQADPVTPNQYDLGHYRGMRDEDRKFPKKLQRGDLWAFDVVDSGGLT